MKKLFGFLVPFVFVSLFTFSSLVYALQGGVVIEVGKSYVGTGINSSSSDKSSSTMIPVRIGYGLADKLEGRAAVAIINSSNISATGYQIALEYQLLKDSTDNINLKFEVPFTIYSLLGVSVNQTGILIDISKDFQGYSPYLTGGVGITSGGSTSVTSYPLSVGLVGYLTNNVNIYGALGISFSNGGGSNSFNASLGTEIKI